MTRARSRSVLERCVVLATLVLGGVGAVIGLVVGLRTYPPTAWFAVFELGVPSALAGVVLGAMIGLIVTSVQKKQS